MAKRTYKIKKSKYYTEEKKNLFISYTYEYFNEKLGEWRETRNINTKEKLKSIVLGNPEALNFMVQF